MNGLQQPVSEPKQERNLSPKSVHYWYGADAAASVLERSLHRKHQRAFKWMVLAWQVQGFPLNECFLQILKGVLVDYLASSAPANRAATETSSLTETS